MDETLPKKRGISIKSNQFRNSGFLQDLGGELASWVWEFYYGYSGVIKYILALQPQLSVLEWGTEAAAAAKTAVVA